MPYFITDQSADCPGWATIKEDGEVIGCHTTKQDAIDQMVAVSIAEGIEPGGERARPTELEVGDYVSWNSSGGRARGEIVQIERDGTINVPDSSFTITGTPDDPAALIQVYQRVEGGWDDTDVYVCPSAELAPENNYHVNDEFKICDIAGITDFYNSQMYDKFLILLYC